MIRTYARTSNDAPALPDDLSTEAAPDEESESDAALAAGPSPHHSAPHVRKLRHGCYLLHYKPHASPLVAFDGTLRVQKHADGCTASGDLYQRRIVFVPHMLPGPVPPHPHAVLGPAPSPVHGIPVQSRPQYRYYLRVTKVLETVTIKAFFTLGFEMHRFDAATQTWASEGEFTARMRWRKGPIGYPSPRDYLVGELRNASGHAVGSLSMGWISKYLRKATVELDRVAVSEAPLDNGDGKNWSSIFDEIGWHVKVVESNADVTEPSGEAWSDAEMHAAMLARRDSANLDAEWRYHILAVRQLDSTPRGIMYDNGATDSNNVPREGVGISSHWMIPDTPEWGLVRNTRFGTAKKPFFRTAVHELGHAFGLYHNTVDFGFMNTTDVIAAGATATTPFPENIQWAYASDDLKRLRHMPDIYVRPGGVPFGTDYAATPISPDDLTCAAEELELTVDPLHDTIPIGAPARVNLRLDNRAQSPVLAPGSLSLGSGFVSGSVRGPDGIARAFTPLVLCLDSEPLQWLAAERGIEGSLTLLRGPQGALFPSSGVYAIEVSVSWDIDGVRRTALGRSRLFVTQARDQDHAQAAMQVLSTPDLLLTLVFGGDHLESANAALQSALANPVLRPHFAYTEARRRLDRFYDRKPQPKAAVEIIDRDTVMSDVERSKLEKKLRGLAAGHKTDELASVLARKLEALPKTAAE